MVIDNFQTVPDFCTLWNLSNHTWINMISWKGQRKTFKIIKVNWTRNWTILSQFPPILPSKNNFTILKVFVETFTPKMKPNKLVCLSATIGDKIVETLYSNRVTSENKRIRTPPLPPPFMGCLLFPVGSLNIVFNSFCHRLSESKSPVWGEVSQLILSLIVAMTNWSLVKASKRKQNGECKPKKKSNEKRVRLKGKSQGHSVT